MLKERHYFLIKSHQSRPTDGIVGGMQWYIYIMLLIVIISPQSVQDEPSPPTIRRSPTGGWDLQLLPEALQAQDDVITAFLWVGHDGGGLHDISYQGENVAKLLYAFGLRRRFFNILYYYR